MRRLFLIPALCALALLSACADGGIGQTQLSQSDIDKQAALTACKAYTYTPRRLPNGDQSFRLAGEPRGRVPYWYEGPNRQIDDCLAARSTPSS